MLAPGIYDSRRLVTAQQGDLVQLPNNKPGAVVLPCQTGKWDLTVYVVTDGPILPRGPVTVSLQEAGRLAQNRATQFAKEQSGGVLLTGNDAVSAIYTASVVAPANWQVLRSETVSIKNGDAKTIVLKLIPPPVWVRFRVVKDATGNPEAGVPVRARVPLLAGDQQLTQNTGGDGIVQHENLRVGADTSIREIGQQDNVAIWYVESMETA